MAEWIRFSDIETIEQMDQWLNEGNNINTRDMSIFYETPLILQAIKGNTDIVKHLINKGADINIRDDTGFTAFVNICEYGHEDLFDYFVEELHVDIDNERPSPIGHACSNGHINIVKKLLNLGAKIDGRDYHAIHHACYGWGNPDNPVEIVDHLIVNGADLNAQNVNNQTPLHLAVYVGNLNIIEKLLSMNVDTTIVDKDGKTAFESIYDEHPHHHKMIELFEKYLNM